MAQALLGGLGPLQIRAMQEQQLAQYLAPKGGGRILAAGSPGAGRDMGSQIGSGLAGLGAGLEKLGAYMDRNKAKEEAEAQRQSKIGAVRNALFGDQNAILAAAGGPTKAAANAMKTASPLGLSPDMAQAVMGIAEADPDLGFKMVSAFVTDARKPKERNIIKGADGFNYYEDTGKRVLPNVQAPVDYNKLFLPDGSLNQAYVAAQREMRGAGATSVNVNTGTTDPQAKIWAEQGGEAFKGYIDTGKKAREMQTSFRNLRGLAKMAEIKPGARVTTGFLKNYDAVADFFGAPSSESLGFDPKQTGAREAVTSMVNNLVLQYKNVVGLGSQGFTEGDRMFLEEVFPRLGDTETGFDLKLQALEGLTNQQVWVSRKASEFRNIQRNKNQIFDDADFQEWLGKQNAPEFFKGLTEEARRAGLLNQVTDPKIPPPQDSVDLDSMTLSEINAWVDGLSRSDLSKLPSDVLDKIIARREGGK